jgi:hypothetical protein
MDGFPSDQLIALTWKTGSWRRAERLGKTDGGIKFLVVGINAARSDSSCNRLPKRRKPSSETLNVPSEID